MNYKNITSFEAACEFKGYNPADNPIVNHLPSQFQEWIVAIYQLGVGAEAINTQEDGSVWKPNYLDGKPKYQAAFWVNATEDKPSGVGFSSADCVFWYSYSIAGSRLCFPTLEKLQHFQKHFESQHIKMQLFID